MTEARGRALARLERIERASAAVVRRGKELGFSKAQTLALLNIRRLEFTEAISWFIEARRRTVLNERHLRIFGGDWMTLSGMAGYRVRIWSLSDEAVKISHELHRVWDAAMEEGDDEV